MDEATWLSSNEPMAMLRHLEVNKWKPSPRKLRLFACAVARQRMMQYAQPREKWASAWHDLEETEDQPERDWFDLRQRIYRHNEAAWIVAQPNADTLSPQPLKAALLRDLFGNPWRPVKLPKVGVVLRGEQPDGFGGQIEREGYCSCLTWNDGTVPRLAQRLYDERSFAAMPILADAMEEAGCTSQDILDHCRQPGAHVRGCWVVDLILGKT